MQARARRGRHLFARDVHGTCDDAPERTTQRERGIDVSSPLYIDVRHCTRTPLVFRWVVEGDQGRGKLGALGASASWEAVGLLARAILVFH